jgi:hypothetical protein
MGSGCPFCPPIGASRSMSTKPKATRTIKDLSHVRAAVPPDHQPIALLKW